MGAMPFSSEYYNEFAAYIKSLGSDNSNEYSRLKSNLRRALIEELTPRQLQMIKMYYIDGIKMCEIAKMLSVSTPTVSRTISRGRRRLKKCLKYGAGSLLHE